MLCSFGRSLSIAATALAIGLATNTVASAQSAFNTLAGSWSGSGQIKLENGKTESLRCRAFYTQKDGGSGLGLAIRCASASNKIELRAALNQNSGQIDGSWEERTYNAAGTVVGRVTASRINMSITGGSFSGSMNVAISGGRHSVSIQTNGIALKAVNIDLSRG